MNVRAHSAVPYPPEVLGSYAFIGDGERGALIGPRGDISWMCAPCWDSDAVFASLVGGDSFYAVTPTERFTWGGYYEAGSLIWHSRWITASGVIECREALGFPGCPDRAVLLRQVHSPEAEQQVAICLAPEGGFGQDPLTDVHHHGRVWTGRLGSLWMRWQGPDDVHVARHGSGGHHLHAKVAVSPGETLDLVLEIGHHEIDGHPPDADAAWQATEETWRREVPEFQQTLDPEGATLAYAVMRGLTSRRGGMVAASTTSLPERAEQGRNYDYRYAWIRDQAYAGRAAGAAGSHGLLDSATQFIAARLLDDGPNLRPAYRIDGTAIPAQRRLDLSGYPGGFDLVGNHVNQQFQLDAFGEALLLFAVAATHDRLDLDGHRAARVAAAAIEQRWQEDDSGIWEIDNRAWTHSRLICAAGLRQVARALGPGSTARRVGGRFWPTRSWPRHRPLLFIQAGTGSGRLRTQALTVRSCSRPSAVPYPLTILEAWRR